MARRTTPLQILMNWRSYVKKISKAVKATIPEAEVYIAGGAANNRLTIRSDIDILIVLPNKPNFAKSVEIRVKILERAEKLKLPLYAPIELHIIGKKELVKYTKRGKIIPLNENKGKRTHS